MPNQKKVTEPEKLDALIFIDTNVLLDLYRSGTPNSSIKFVDEFVKHRELMILTNQVEMEFSKNRQKVLSESIHAFKKPDLPPINLPPLVNLDENSTEQKKIKKDFDDHKARLFEDLINMLASPESNDAVFIAVSNLYRESSPYHLRDSGKQFKKIKTKAHNRYLLGYPPRKSSDTSIGDAINWEWIIKSAKASKKHIILVSRDTDYGSTDFNKPLLNDFLRHEFKERVGPEQKILFTNRLSEAFQRVNIPVTPEMINDENLFISKRQSIENNYSKTYTDLLSQIAALSSLNTFKSNFYKSSNLEEYIKLLLDRTKKLNDNDSDVSGLDPVNE